MARVNAYLTFNGRCEEAFNFYKSVFGGEFMTFSRFRDMPAMEGQEIPASLKERIMHVSLPLSKETILMGSDANPMFGEITIGQNISLSVETENREEANKLFMALSENGKITMPIADTFWGAYFGMVTDKFDNIWMVSYDNRKKES